MAPLLDYETWVENSFLQSIQKSWNTNLNFLSTTFTGLKKNHYSTNFSQTNVWSYWNCSSDGKTSTN